VSDSSDPNGLRRLARSRPEVGRERLDDPIRHNRGALTRRAHFANHRNRNVVSPNGSLDRVRSVWRDSDQQCARRNQFQRIEPECTANP
jgi:hypothetical protein